MSGHIHLVLGGSRSGKSKRAQELAAERSEGVVYIATYATGRNDPEMELRIGRHKSTRPSHWRTIENQFNLMEVMERTGGQVFLLDCLTLWLAYQHGEGVEESEILGNLAETLAFVRDRAGTMIIVSNELGLGLVPVESANREFRDLCGLANQLTASAADSVEFLIAGIPWKLK